MNHKKLVIVVIVFLILGLGFYLWPNPDDPLPEPTAPTTTGTSSAAPPAKTPRPVHPAPQAGTSAVSPLFVDFVRTEATLVDKPRIDADGSEQSMRDQATAMGQYEIRYAKETALSDKASANEKILSVALLSATGVKGFASIADFISSPLKGRPNPAPHTVEEAKSMQEKALRVMAIDALADQAATSAEARDRLHRAASDVQNADLRAHILKRIQELPPL